MGWLGDLKVLGVSRGLRSSSGASCRSSETKPDTQQPGEGHEALTPLTWVQVGKTGL